MRVSGRGDAHDWHEYGTTGTARNSDIKLHSAYIRLLALASVPTNSYIYFKLHI